TFTLFFTRAFIFSTWVSRGPEVKDLLSLNTVEMGLFTMIFPVGGILGVVFSSTLVQRYGSKLVTYAIYSLAAVAMVLLGFTISAGLVLVSGFLLLLIGLPMAIADYVGNYEGALVDQASTRSIFSAIHGAFGLGMLLGAGISSVLLNAGLAIETHFLVIAVVSGAGALWAGKVLPIHARSEITAEEKAHNRKLVIKVWGEKRSLMIALIGFSFIMAETSFGTWGPIALTESGFSEAEAAAALSVFWIVVTVFRLIGGWVVDTLGRWYTILVSALLTSLGIILFMLVDVIAIPYVALILWGAGMAIGFPMAVAAMGDDKDMAPARINMIITVVYISSMTVGPALGAVGQSFGIYAAFVIPLAFLFASAGISKVTKPATV
ncbi:MAG: hypothetical protein RL038_874, partial [Actinomycetota bacterium]